MRSVGPLASRAQKNHVKLILEKLRDYLVDEQREDEGVPLALFVLLS